MTTSTSTSATSRQVLRAAAVAASAAVALAGCAQQTTTSQATTPAAATGGTTDGSAGATTSPTTPPAGTTSSAGPTGPAAEQSGAPAPVDATTAGAATPAGPDVAARTVASASGAALPVYFLGRDGTQVREGGGAPTPRLRLFREFVPTPRPGSTAQRAETAANVAMREAGSRGYLNVWGERTVTDVSVGASTIEVTLDGPTRAVDDATARIGTASVVWTVTAVTGKNLPVRFRSPDGRVLGPLPTSKTYARSSGVAQTGELAAVWIDSPGAGAALKAGPVVATGQACAFEGTVAYSLTRAGKAVRSGHTTASVGCPTRGTWRLDLGRLGAGSYQLQVWAPSPADGQRDLGRATRTFTVR